MRSKFVAFVFFLIWGVAYFGWGWNGWGAFLFAAFCSGGLSSLLTSGSTNSAPQDGSGARSSLNSNKSIMGKVCKNLACGYQNSWSAFKCKRCGRFLGV